MGDSGTPLLSVVQTRDGVWSLFLMGLIPGMSTLFGVLPLHGHDVWLHAGTAAVAALQRGLSPRGRARPAKNR